MQRPGLSGWSLLALGALCLGCGGGVEHDPVFPVTGTVKLNGEPLEGAVVTFSPVDAAGKAAVGTTDASGKYELTTWTSGDGAQAGSYRVAISKYEAPEGVELAEAVPAAPAEVNFDDPNFNEYPAGYDEMAANEQAGAVSKNILPAKFADPRTSGFQADVAAGDNPPKDFNVQN